MGYVTRADGFIALQHRNSNPATVQMEADDTLYSFEPRFNVSLAWVDPKHLDTLLKVKAKTCCGKQDYKFIPASQINVNLWTTGNREGVVS